VQAGHHAKGSQGRRGRGRFRCGGRGRLQDEGRSGDRVVSGRIHGLLHEIPLVLLA
jgi:hypothetical protein